MQAKGEFEVKRIPQDELDIGQGATVAAQPTAGNGYELDAIAAVVLGGTSLAGGRGRIFGTLVGAVIIGVLSNGLVLLDVPFFYQLMIKGVVIIIAIALDSLKRFSRAGT